ncbi:DEAD/DEAH box helicase family protein [Clostridium sp.]|uniref:type I restriction endonuclease subunit R n=1 Tax=Clostridium sp. TaxID=1506 RepID=UPI0032169B49
MNNFNFIGEVSKHLEHLGIDMEKYCISQKDACMLEIDFYFNHLVDLLCSKLEMNIEKDTSIIEKINLIQESGQVKISVIRVLELIRRNIVDFQFAKITDKAILLCLERCFKLTKWFYSYVSGDNKKINKCYIMPIDTNIKIDFNKEYIEKKRKENDSNCKLDMIQFNAIKKSKSIDKLCLDQITDDLGLTEEDTRKLIIDIMLKDVGWDVNDENFVELEFEVNGYNANPSGTGRIDYLLKNKKGDPIAIIEAKKTSVDPLTGKKQAKLYADSIEKMYGIRPVIFYTNGFNTWIWDDIAKSSGAPREIWGFYSLDELEFMIMQRDILKPLNIQNIEKSIVDREYQLKAIEDIFNTFTNGNRRALAVMATGTGKTRTAIALTKCLIEANYARRVLFLVDRDELIDQAMEGDNSFKTFTKYTRVRIKANTANDRDKCLYFSTYQAMSRYYRNFGVGFFDLIICDESHRSIYKVYKDIIEYFDAYLLGMTATPNELIHKNTYKVFKCIGKKPTTSYTYDEALANVPPYLCKYTSIKASSKFLTKGIKWSQLSEEQQEQLTDEGYEEGLINFNVSQLGNSISNVATDRYIISTLLQHGIRVKGEIGKSIIFARNIPHANDLLKLIDEMCPESNGKIAVAIHDKVKHNKVLLEEFKNNDMPRIAISVDILDTGVDIPEIVNLSFAKSTRSKTKFLQMIGRGVRLCENIFGKGMDKEEFLIIDHFGNFEFFDMNPEGYKPKFPESLIQIRFRSIIKLLELYSVKSKEVLSTSILKNIVKDIRGEIAKLDLRSPIIRKHIEVIEQIKKKQRWNIIDENLIKILKLHIVPLMAYVSNKEDFSSISFDTKIYEIIRLKLCDNNEYKVSINLMIAELIKLRLNLNVFDGKREYFTEWMEQNKWYNSSCDEIYEFRIQARDFMRYKNTNEKLRLGIDVEDSDFKIEDIKNETNKFKTKSQMIEEAKLIIESKDFLKNLIKKIKNGCSIDREEIEKNIKLYNETVTEYDLKMLCKLTGVNDEKNIVAIIRKLIGINEKVLNDKFENIIVKHKIVETKELDILKLIPKDIVTNNGIGLDSLYKAPYTNISSKGIDGIFSEEIVDEIFEVIENYKI